MTSVNDFLMENVNSEPELREVAFKRFKAPFKIKSLTAEENSQLQKNATRKIRDKRTRQITTEVDQDKYVDLLIEASVVEPDLHDEKLQKNWGVIADASGLLKKMLLAGEYAELANQIQDLSGFDIEDINDLVDEVKN